MNLGPNSVSRVCSLREILPWLRGTNFCTSSTRFAQSFLRQLKGHKCLQIVQHTPKHEFRSQQGQSGAFVAKNSDTTSWHELLHHFGPFCTEFCKATKQSQMHPNSTKHKKNMNLESHGVDRVHSLQKIPTRFRGTNFCTSLARFALSVVTQPNYPKCTQIVQNAPKHEVRVQWGGSGAFA